MKIGMAFALALFLGSSAFAGQTCLTSEKNEMKICWDELANIGVDQYYNIQVGSEKAVKYKMVTRKFIESHETFGMHRNGKITWSTYQDSMKSDDGKTVSLKEVAKGSWAPYYFVAKYQGHDLAIDSRSVEDNGN